MEYRINKKGFTLAEALITLVIIGVIAALTIPAILVNTEQHEYKTALKKALSALNQVIEMSIALEGYGPIEISDSGGNMEADEDTIYSFFKRRMNVISTSNDYDGGSGNNWAFFTADGMRYEFPYQPSVKGGSWSEHNSNCARPGANVQDDTGTEKSLPCLIIVDVNGERKPNPRKMRDSYKVPGVSGRSKILDVFPIIVTDINAYPYGVVGQRAMFQHY